MTHLNWPDVVRAFYYPLTFLIIFGGVSCLIITVAMLLNGLARLVHAYKGFPE